MPLVKRLISLLALSIWLVPAACDSPGDRRSEHHSKAPRSAEPNGRNERANDTSENRKLARPKPSWVDRRVREAKRRLDETEAGSIVWKSIRAHGGLETWYANGPLYFHYNYQPLGERDPRNTFQTVDTWSARARHQMPERRDHEYGWDGELAWYAPADWEPPYDVRFWALTPYYFVGMPFVLADPGVQLEYEGTDELEGRTYDVVRATFGEVGISPDDFYVLYIDVESRRLGALRYIVSYPEFFPDGGHSPQKLMTYDGRQTVGGITFAESYRFYLWDPDAEAAGEKVTEAKLSDVEFRPDVAADYFDGPAGAEVVEAPGDSDTR